MTIIPLRHRPDLARQLATWHEREWRHLYRDWDGEVALRGLQSEPQDGRLPQTLLALDEDRLVGSVSDVFNDLPGREDLNPWVASFYVIEEARRHGVGGQLLAAAEELLRAQGIQQAFLFTESAQRFFEKRGWHGLEPAVANSHPVMIMTKRLAAP